MSISGYIERSYASICGFKQGIEEGKEKLLGG